MKKIIFICLLLSLSLSANAQWVQVWNGMGQTETVNSTLWSDSFLLAGLYSKGIYKSTNEGLTWEVTSLNNKIIWDLISFGANYFASTLNGIYISNNGTTWTSFALSNREVYEVAINGNYMFAGTNNYGVYYSTNNGVSWTQSFLNNKDVRSLAVYNNYVIAGTYYYGIYYSTDNGYVWSQSHLNNLTVERIKFDGTIAYAGTSNGIYKSTNFGVNWVQFGLAGKNINDLIFSNNYIYAGTDDDGVFISTREGLIWTQINDGFPSGDIDINALAFTNNYFVAGSTVKSAWRRLKSQVGVKYISSQVPSSFTLNQNYPNPFNPYTTITFNTQKLINIKISVMDALGREIETLFNEKLSPGIYETTWDGSNFSSGVYFYRMQAGDFTETKRMILLK